MKEIVIPQFITKFSIDTFMVRESLLNIVVYLIQLNVDTVWTYVVMDAYVIIYQYIHTYFYIWKCTRFCVVVYQWPKQSE